MKIKLYTCYSPSHKVFFEEYFSKTLPNDEFEVFVEEIPQECPSGEWYQHGWDSACFHKVKLFLKACKDNMGGLFVFSDVDIQFFGPLKDILIDELGEFDIACQNDTADTYCSGFFICRANESTLKLFEDMVNKFEREDQFSLNKFIRINNIKAKFLSNRFLTIGNIINGSWDESKGTVFFPRNTLMYHANFTIGISNKIKLLEMAKYQLR